VLQDDHAKAHLAAQRLDHRPAESTLSYSRAYNFSYNSPFE
jgi:hypothetical protein